MSHLAEHNAHRAQLDELGFDCGCDGDLDGIELKVEDQIELALDDAAPTITISRRRAIAYMGGFLLLAACGGQDTATEEADTDRAPTSTHGSLIPVDLAFCSQVLCILPFEVARQRGYFEDEGLDVNLIYMRGGPPAITALLAKQLDFVGTPIDLVVRATDEGKPLVMVTSTSRLPFFALLTAPEQADEIQSIADLRGKKVGVGTVGSTDDLLLRYLLAQHGVPLEEVETIGLGPNLFEQLMSGQVDAGMVQEPSLTLGQERGSRVLINFMDLQDTEENLGGAYQFMGLNTRPDVLEDPKKIEQLQGISRALVRANQWILENPGTEIVKFAPPELFSGASPEVFATALDNHKADLYPSDGAINSESVARVIDVQRKAGLIAEGKELAPDQVFTNQFVETR